MERKAIDFAVAKGRGKDVNFLHIQQSHREYLGEKLEKLADEVEKPKREFIKSSDMTDTIINMLWGINEVAMHNQVYADRQELSMANVTTMDFELTRELTRKINEVDYVVLTALSDHEAFTMIKRLLEEVPVLKGRLMVVVNSQSTANSIRDSGLFVETFVPSQAVIEAFAKTKSTK